MTGSHETVDVVVIGAGAVGLAVARALALAGREVYVLECAGAIGTQTSSHNSEVIHAGLYYPPGSLKARMCLAGKDALYAYLKARHIPYRRCGKLVVASRADQVDRLNAIRRNAEASGLHDLEELDGADVGRIEPLVSAIGGLFSPSTGIFDTHAYMLALQADLEAAGGQVVLHTPVAQIDMMVNGFKVRTGGADPMQIEASAVVNAAGLAAVDVAHQIDGLDAVHIPTAHYAVGHYYALSGAAPFSHLVYPVPEPGGLGIHVTLDMAGQVRFGPDVRWIAAPDYSFDDSRRTAFIEAIEAYYPGIDPARLAPAMTGVRPKISGPDDPAADFRIDGPQVHGIDGLVNLFGIESPGMTASLAIADDVIKKLS